jgi:hypothetical protein
MGVVWGRGLQSNLAVPGGVFRSVSQQTRGLSRERAWFSIALQTDVAFGALPLLSLVQMSISVCIRTTESGGLVMQSSTACWARDHEFGVAFVAIDPEGTQQLASMWSALAPLWSRVKAS